MFWAFSTRDITRPLVAPQGETEYMTPVFIEYFVNLITDYSKYTRDQSINPRRGGRGGAVRTLSYVMTIFARMTVGIDGALFTTQHDYT